MILHERFLKAKQDYEFDSNGDNGINELIMYAYYLGRHEVAKECCDEARIIFEEQQKRAKECRYYKLAEKVQGNIGGIYHGDYSRDFVDMFKDDEIKGEL
jgi:hypothetical protein